jgi:hypothetical protein
MRIGQIVLKLRLANTSLGNFISGAGDLASAYASTLRREMAFVIPLAERATDNQYDNGLIQTLTERFGVIVALSNDVSQADKTGITAFDKLHNIRSELFQAILNIELTDTCSSIYYVGGSLLDINPTYLWYQFEFEFKSRIVSNIDGVADLENRVVDDRKQRSQLEDFNTIYANYILSPSADLPYSGQLPLADGFPNVVLPDQSQYIDLTKDPDDGAFGCAFASAFKIDTHS